MTDDEFYDGFVAQMADRTQTFMKRARIEHEEDWRGIMDNIPALNFQPEWSVQIIPPFCGAVVRFVINKRLSVYLDWYDTLACMGQPYWEVMDFPSDCDDNNPSRFLLNETTELMDYLAKKIGE